MVLCGLPGVERTFEQLEGAWAEDKAKIARGAWLLRSRIPLKACLDHGT